MYQFYTISTISSNKILFLNVNQGYIPEIIYKQGQNPTTIFKNLVGQETEEAIDLLVINCKAAAGKYLGIDKFDVCFIYFETKYS